MSKSEKVLIALAVIFVGLALFFRPGGESVIPAAECYTAPAVNPVEEKVTPVEVVLTERIDLNTATVRELTALPGVGKVTAERLVAWREEHGPFESLEDILQVDGVKPSVLEKLYDAMEDSD